MEHEALPLLALERLDLLRIVGRAECAGDERLRLASRENGRAVSPRQHARFDPDRPDLVELAAIEPYAALEDFVPQDLFLEVLEDLLRFGLALGFAFGQARDEIGKDLVDAPIVVEFVPHAHGFSEGSEHLALDFAVERLVDFLLGDLELRLAGVLGKRVDAADDRLDGGVGGIQRFDHLGLGDLLGARLDHDQTVHGAGHDEVDQALLALGKARVDDVLAVHEADADAGDRLLEGDLRERQGRRGAGDSQHVRVVLGVGGQDQRDDLRLVAPTRREERPDGPVDAAAGQDFLLGGFPFALEEAARDASGGVGVLAVIDGEREEIDAFPRAGRTTGRDEHDRVAGPDDDGTAGLLRELAGFDVDGPWTNRDVARMHSVQNHRYFRMLRRLIRSA